jgi:hypothetical protein
MFQVKDIPDYKIIALFGLVTKMSEIIWLFAKSSK